MEKIYYVRFRKALLDSNGRPATARQGAVEVRARDQDRAFEPGAKICRVEGCRGVVDACRLRNVGTALLASRKRLSKRIARNRMTEPLVGHREFV